MIGLANAGADTVNSIKQAAEFGIVQAGQKLAGLLLFINNVHSLGTQTAQGLQMTTAFYWDMHDDTRAFCSIPARHDVARRSDCAYLATLVGTGRLGESEAFEVAHDLTYRLAKDAYRL